MNYKIAATSASAGVLGITILVLCFVMSDSTAATGMNLTIVVLGCALGWLTGIIATPYDLKEQSRFQLYTRAISLFLSGYVLAKVDRVIEHLISVESLQQQAVFFRVLVFISAFLLTVIVVFVYRQYALIEPGSRKL